VKNLVFQKPELYEEIAAIVLANEEPYSRRAIWVMDTCDEERPGWAEPYLEPLIDHLEVFGHDGLRRHALRILSRHRIPDHKLVKVMDHCFEMLTTFQSAAVKVHAMEILYHLSQRMPEIKNELVSATELAIQEGSSGVKNRGVRLLDRLMKEMEENNNSDQF
jgi:hypothetical protein